MRRLSAPLQQGRDACLKVTYVPINLLDNRYPQGSWPWEIGTDKAAVWALRLPAVPAMLGCGMSSPQDSSFQNGEKDFYMS